MRKIPLRKCVVTQEQFPKQELLRIVLTPEGQVEIDPTGRKNGRGAYIHPTKEVIRQAQAMKVLDRALKIKVEPTIYEELLNYVQ